MWGIFYLYYLYYTLPGSKARMGSKSQAVWTKTIQERSGATTGSRPFHTNESCVRDGGRCDELVCYCTNETETGDHYTPTSLWTSRLVRRKEQRLCNWVNMEISSHGDSTVTEQPVGLSHGCPLNNYWNFFLLKREGSVWGIRANVHNYFHISHFVLFIKTDLKGNSALMNEYRVTISQPPC